MAGEASGKNRTEGVGKISLFSDSGPQNAAMGRQAPPEAAQPQRLNQAASAPETNAAAKPIGGQLDAVYQTNQTNSGAPVAPAGTAAWRSGGGSGVGPPAGAH